MPLVRGLTGRKVGIYGLGTIGEQIARRAAAFAMEIGYHNRRRRPDVSYPYYATLRDLARWADVLVIAVRAGPGNRHAVDAGILAALGPEGHVVNIARGSVIDEAALIRALREGLIAGAGLDVFEREPSVPDELVALENVVLTPHIAGGTLEAQAALQDLVVANVDAFFAGDPVLTPVPELHAGAATSL
jgi:glyoxylate reductase